MTAARAAQRVVMPVDNARVTSPFGARRHPVKRVSHVHTGIDLAAPIGTPVRAAAQGVVKVIGFERRGFGRYIVLSHRYGSETVYAHLSATARSLRVGKAVRAGDVIGAVGKSGMVTGAHLHFELRRGGEPVDPGPLLRRAALAATNEATGDTHVASAPNTHDCESAESAVAPGHLHGGSAAATHWQYAPL